MLGQDAGFKVAQGWPGVDAELADQAVTDFGTGLQGLGLAPGPIQRQDAQFPQALAQRVLPAPCLQSGGEPAVGGPHPGLSGPGSPPAAVATPPRTGSWSRARSASKKPA